jgi:hypothetical protein
MRKSARKMESKMSLNKLANKLITLSFYEDFSTDQKNDMLFLIPEVINTVAKSYENYILDLEYQDKNSLLYDENWDGSHTHDIFKKLLNNLIDLEIDVNLDNDDEMNKDQKEIINILEEYFEGIYAYVLYVRNEN